MDTELFPEVFVIIVTFNGMYYYDRLFNSLRALSSPVKVVVVDNNSSDDTVQYISASFPEVHIITSNDNLGFGRANNIGIRYAIESGADYVFLLNQDTVVEPNVIADLVRIHQNNPAYGIVCPIHLNLEKDKIESGLLRLLNNYSITDSSLFEDLYFGRLKGAYQSSSINAAAWLIPKEVIMTVGGFDPLFIHYGEDDNYLQRIHFHGYKVCICPSVRIVHDTANRSNSGNGVFSNNREAIIQLANVNENPSFIRYFVAETRKAIMSFLHSRKAEASKHISNARYCLSNKKNILNSRKENSKKQPSWIF